MPCCGPMLLWHRPCSNRSISPTRWAHSSKLTTCSGSRHMDTGLFHRSCSAYYTSSANKASSDIPFLCSVVSHSAPRPSLTLITESRQNWSHISADTLELAGDEYLTHRNAEISLSKAGLMNVNQHRVNSGNVLDTPDLKQHIQHMVVLAFTVI